MMEWLKQQEVFIKANTLGHKTIQMLGYLFFMHPNMTHHVLLH